MPSKLSLSGPIPAERLQLSPDLSSLKDKKILITGGASGLGAAFVEAFAQAGAYVTIADLNEPLANKNAESLREKGHNVQAITTDVTSWPSQISAFKSALGFGPGPARLDHVVASAGIDPAQPFFPPVESVTPSAESAPEEPNTRVLDVNVKGVVYTTRLAQYYMNIPPSSSSSGSHSPDKAITLIASSGAYFPIPLNGSYTASKGALRALFHTLRGPMASRGIRFNMIAPWLIRTPMTEGLLDVFGRIGYPVGETAVVARAVIHVATDRGIVGRVLQAGMGGREVTDWRDDQEGGHGGEETDGLVGRYLGGWEGLRGMNEGILGAFGFEGMGETF